ncbi:MAG TPA: cyclodeaminase/cyclohydrolase family protein [Patescibacteria group bacterium]|nr:cyclodeaminase/cyclohydrolase family protein [Patescibacteria group bacterium]
MDTRPSDLTVGAFIEQLASDAPAPGGGSASALAGAMGAALVQMVVSLTTGRGDAASVEDDLRELGLAAAGFQSELLQLVEIDAAAYASVIAARRLPRETDRERDLRRQQIDAAVREATRSPLIIAERAHEVLGLAERLAPIGSRNAISDAGVAGLLAGAALRGAALNVRINLPYLPEDEPLRDEAGARVDELLSGLEAREAALRAAVAERLG